MGTPPPFPALESILGPTSRVTRRIEIYESDGVTRWSGDTAVRLKDGQISADYSREERRSIDLELDNQDGGLINAPTQFWYDKIIKAYRGVNVREAARPPKILVIYDAQDANAGPFRDALVSHGFDDVRVNTLAADMLDLVGYEIIVALGDTTALPVATTDLLTLAYEAGYSVFTNGDDTPTTQIPFLVSSATIPAGTQWGIKPNRSSAHPLTRGWAEQATDKDSGVCATSVRTGAVAVSVYTLNSTSCVTIAAEVNPNGQGGRWVHQQSPLAYDVNSASFYGVAMQWLNPFKPVFEWETQIGEFMIDRISEAHFPHSVKVTGRDYTKKCLTSKFARATQFDTGQFLEDIIRAIAANAGITKFVMPLTGVTVNRTFFFERGTERWKAMRDIASAYNYDIYFDGQGYLRLTQFGDPYTTAPSFIFETGRYGSLASYEKSTNDTRIYNHIVVTGESSDQTVLPPSAEAVNTDPMSPTRIDKIGDRVYQYTSSFIETDLQAQDVANRFLKMYALEEFELGFSSIVLPWLDVGEIVTWVDPRPAPDDPDRFLLSSLSIPLGLGVMSGSGKRITAVGDA